MKPVCLGCHTAAERVKTTDCNVAPLEYLSWTCEYCGLYNEIPRWLSELYPPEDLEVTISLGIAASVEKKLAFVRAA